LQAPDEPTWLGKPLARLLSSAHVSVADATAWFWGWSRAMRQVLPSAGGPQHARLGVLALSTLACGSGLPALSKAAGARVPGLWGASGEL